MRQSGPWEKPARGILLAVIVLATSCLVRNANGNIGNIEGIDGNAAHATLEELSGERYAGRITGSAGNALARGYLYARLEQAGFAVSTIEFSDRVALNDGSAVLEISTSGSAGSVTACAYRVDFREAPRGAYDGGRADGPAFVLPARDAEFPRGSVLVVAAALYRQEAVDGWAAAGAAGLLVELSEGDTSQRPLWAGQPPGTLAVVRHGMPVLALSREAYARIAAAVSAGPVTVRMASPLRFTDVTGTNLLAAWNGDGGAFTPRLVVMAHYDHVGTDPDGSRFPGALDNASGVGLALSLAEAFARDRVRADVAVLFTDSEESGLAGSHAFAAAPPFPLTGISVVNIDMVGSRADTTYSVYSSGGQASVLLGLDVEKALRAAGIKVKSEYPVPSLDHDPLARAGAAAVSVCEYDTTRYHRKTDTAGFIDPAELDAVGDALYSFMRAHLGF